MVDQVPANTVEVPAIAPPAFYGKIPGHGDFVGRGLSAEQEAAIDRWLAGWIAVAREEWAGTFESSYRDAQPWLFAGPRLSAIAIPSADRVGRLFPLLAAVEAGVPVQGLYDTVVAAIAESWDGDRLLTALGNLPAGDADALSDAGWFLPDEDARAMPHPLAGGGATVAQEMLA